MDIAQEMLTTFNDDSDLFKKVKTVDESWVYSYDIETKAKLCQWKRAEEPRPIKTTSSSVKCDCFTHSFLRLQWCNKS